MEPRNIVDAVGVISARAAKMKSLCTAMHEVMDSGPLLEDEAAKEWSIVVQDLLGVVEDEIETLSKEVRDAEKAAFDVGKPEEKIHLVQ
jgi:hypothetical protein